MKRLRRFLATTLILTLVYWFGFFSAPSDPPPPQWVKDFAGAFCTANMTYLYAHAGGSLAHARPLPADWPCVSVIRYLGWGRLAGGQITYYFRFDFADHQPTYGFVTEAEKVVGVE